MASRDMEGPLLGIKTYRADPGNWLAKGLGDTSRVLTLSMKGESPYFPKNVEYSSWEHFEEGQLEIDSPDANYDAVYFTNVLDRYSPEDQKKLIVEAARVTKNGGRIVAYHPACDDAEAAYELAKSYGVDTAEFLRRRMTNKGIARLKPHDAAFFQGLLNVPNKNRLVKVLQGMGLNATLEHMWTVKERFAIRRFHVGMAWFVNRS